MPGLVVLPWSSSAVSGLTALPGGLLWAPDGLSVESRRACKDLYKMPALELCEHAGGKAGVYEVEHYSVDATGFAFGPLGLDRLLHFCRGLDELLLQRGAVVLHAHRDHRAYRLNALVLLGGYLAIRHQWTTKKIGGVLRDGEAKFECSWSRNRTPEEERVLRVKDCWAGIELAARRKWIEVGCIEADQKLKAFMSVHSRTAHFFDAAWIIPGLVMVAADPISVITDGNPSSCKQMFPKQKHTPQRTGATQRKDATAEFSEQDAEEVEGDVCAASDFASFFAESHIGLIIRLNSDTKDSPHAKSYRDGALRPHGIEEVNINVADKKGSLPSEEDVRDVLQGCEGYLDPARSVQPAVLVHGREGFGHSATLACCLAIFRFNLSGAAVLGWVRVTRPGAITSRRQELFVKSLRGSADVARFAQLPVVAGRRQPAGKDACAIQ